MSKVTVPEVHAYSPGPAILKTRPHLANVWLVPCPFCNRVHSHGAMEGRRVPHCPAQDGPHAYLLEGRDRPAAYTLVHAGETNDADIFKKESARLRAKERAYVRTFRDNAAAKRAASRSSY